MNHTSKDIVKQTGKKIRQNYCYVCKVQCTAEKNLLDHQKGKKHLKNIQAIELEKKKKPDKSRKNSVVTLNSPKTDIKSSNEVKEHETQQDSSHSDQLLTNKIMSNSNRHTLKGNRYHVNPHHGNKYSKYQDSQYSYSNSYKNDRHWNERPYGPHWNPSFSNSPSMFNAPNHNFSVGQRNQYYPEPFNAPNENSYFPQSRNVYFNSYENCGLFQPTSEHFEQNSDFSVYGGTNFETSEISQYQSNLSSSEGAVKHNRKYHSEDVLPSSSETSSKKQTDQSDINKTRNSVNTSKSNASTSKEASKFLEMILNFQTKKRTRSRSLSASESGGENKGKDKNDSQADSDGASEEQRIKEWTNSILETSNNQISRLIHPSNYKEKAAVNHLITKFSKSKRNEILTKTLRSNSLESPENVTEDTTQDLNVSAESVSSVSEKLLPDNISDFRGNISNVESNSIKNKKNLSKHSDSEQNLLSEHSVGETTNKKSHINQNPKKTNKPSGKNKDSNFVSNENSLENSTSSVIHQEKHVKRKKSDGSFDNKKKKPRHRSAESSNRTHTEKIIDTSTEIPATENSTDSSDSSRKTQYQASSNELGYLKTELPEPEETQDVNNQVTSSKSVNSEITPDQDLSQNSGISVETLLELFASGNVKVKEEFYDPVMDALKEMNPEELISACSGEFVNTNKTASKSMNSNRRNSKDKPASEASSSISQENRDCTNPINPVIVGSVDIPQNTTPTSETRVSNQTLPNVSLPNKSENQSCASSNNVAGSSDNSLSEVKKLNLLNKNKAELPPHLDKLIKQLQDVASQEDMVQQSLTEAKSKINEYNAILEEWKSKKKKLQVQEEDLRKQRNEIIKLMQSSIARSDDASEAEQTSFSLTEKTNPADQPSSSKQSLERTVITENCSEESHSLSTVPLIRKKQTEKHLSGPSETDEITILPIPKADPPEIIIVDDTEENAPLTVGNKSSRSNDSRNEMVTNIVSNREPTLYDQKSINAHPSIINCLVVFEDFLYTCSNDSTAKRFSLKSTSSVVTYLHAAKNVTEVVVEKVQNEALVLTSCSTKLISLFIASSGTKIKSFVQPSSVMSICKGWGKFYSGLANGSINVYNWKHEEIEILKTETPVYRIATAHQGRLHVLIILSSEGNICIRDAETGLLIRYVKISVKQPSWMTLHSDLLYLSSSEKVLFVLDIMSGRVEKKIYFSSHTSGLAVYDDYIFTISYSGVINCYNKEKSCDRKLFYGAGKNGLTCVHVYQDWVFTGNRKGDISLFKFDPNSTVVCEFGRCYGIFGLNEDLEHHVEKDHLTKKRNQLKCDWLGCNFRFPRNSDIKDKMNHLRAHIY